MTEFTGPIPRQPRPVRHRLLTAAVLGFVGLGILGMGVSSMHGTPDAVALRANLFTMACLAFVLIGCVCDALIEPIPGVDRPGLDRATQRFRIAILLCYAVTTYLFAMCAQAYFAQNVAVLMGPVTVALLAIPISRLSRVIVMLAGTRCMA